MPHSRVFPHAACEPFPLLLQNSLNNCSSSSSSRALALQRFYHPALGAGCCFRGRGGSGSLRAPRARPVPSRPVRAGWQQGLCPWGFTMTASHFFCPPKRSFLCRKSAEGLCVVRSRLESRGEAGIGACCRFQSRHSPLSVLRGGILPPGIIPGCSLLEIISYFQFIPFFLLAG